MYYVLITIKHNMKYQNKIENRLCLAIIFFYYQLVNHPTYVKIRYYIIIQQKIMTSLKAIKNEITITLVCQEDYNLLLFRTC